MSIIDTSTAPSDGTPQGDTPSAEPVTAAPQEPAATDQDVYMVKVDGEEQQVTLDELRSGYQRQSDYTKKTQELANTRKRLSQVEALADALDRDPVGTIKVLGEAYKLPQEDSQSWDEMDPQEQRISRLEQELSAQRSREARSTIENEFRTLESEFGEIDRQEVATFALRNDLNVTDAYRVLQFDRLRAEKDQLAQEAHVVDQKRNAQLPHQSGGTQRGALAPNTQGKKLNLQEAYLAAKQELGQSA